jgi:hypothetical protein
MADQDGTPKLLLEMNSLFGGQKTEVVKVDSNDLDPIAEARRNLIAFLVQPTFLDAIGDAACWFSGAAFFFALYVHTPVLIILQVPLAIVIFTACCGGIATIFTIPQLTPHIIFRLFLVVLGSTFGVAQ